MVYARDLLRKGGAWLGAAHSWLQRHKLNGERVIWGSGDELKPPMTVAQAEEICAEAVAADRNAPERNRGESSERVALAAQVALLRRALIACKDWICQSELDREEWPGGRSHTDVERQAATALAITREKTTVIEPELVERLEDLLGETVFNLLLMHPLPWTTEADWTVDVLDRDSELVIKCRTHQTAVLLIALAEKIQRGMDEVEAALQKGDSDGE